ncbi:MAG TPA: hypothetical protein VLU94_01510, partial [Candidatus Nitrosotalea sp.]|nr:hypothetical protein [Candidatus Nitrosotalea sp.]
SDTFGNLFIADSVNFVVRRVDANGTISTVAGNGKGGNAPDGVPASVIGISPSAVATDDDGNLYIVDNIFNVILKVTSDGISHNVAGGPTSKTQLSFPHGIALNHDGDMFVADTGNGRIVQIHQSGTLSVLAGRGATGPAAAPLHAPWGIALDRSGTVYFTDGPQILRIKDGTVETVAGTSQAYSGDGGPAAAARFLTPLGITFDHSGNLLVADAAANAIRMIGFDLPNSGAPGQISAVVNGASGLEGPVSPGEIVVIYGSALGPSTLVGNAPNPSGIFEKQTAGVSVLFNGIPAAMLYASSTVLSAVVPYGLAGPTAKVAVLVGHVLGPSVDVKLNDTSPALFATSGGTGQAAALNQDGTVNTVANPCPIGSAIVLFATGEGRISPDGVDGAVTGSSPSKPVLPVAVFIGDQPATILYAGEAPGAISGMLQVNALVPSGIQPGVVSVSLQVGAVVSPAGTTIAVSSPQ